MLIYAITWNTVWYLTHVQKMLFICYSPNEIFSTWSLLWYCFVLLMVLSNQIYVLNVLRFNFT